MELNNQDAKSFNFDFLSKVDFSKLPEHLDIKNDDTTVISELKQANVISNVPSRFSLTTFKDLKQGFIPQVKSFCLQSVSDKVFLLFGKVGLGKTSAMIAAIHERRLNGLDSGYYFSNRFLMPKLRTSRSFSAKENEEQLYQKFSTVSFLCLDEVGSVPNIAEEREFLNTVISARFDNMLPTFISTNLTPFEFKCLIAGIDAKSMPPDEQRKRNAELDKENAILNRLKSVSIPVVLTGESFRTRG